MPLIRPQPVECITILASVHFISLNLLTKLSTTFFISLLEMISASVVDGDDTAAAEFDGKMLAEFSAGGGGSEASMLRGGLRARAAVAAVSAEARPSMSGGRGPRAAVAAWARLCQCRTASGLPSAPLSLTLPPSPLSGGYEPRRRGVPAGLLVVSFRRIARRQTQLVSLTTVGEFVDEARGEPTSGAADLAVSARRWRALAGAVMPT